MCRAGILDVGVSSKQGIQHVKANLPPSSGADDHLNGIVADA